MLRRAEFPLIDLDAIGVACFGDENPELMNAGLNSRVWLLGREVVKTTRARMDRSSADELRATMQYEHAVLEDFIGEYIPDTTYTVADCTDDSGAHIVAVQPFVEGVSLHDYWQSADDFHSLRVFFEKCLKIYDKAGLMPDIAIPRTGFNVARSRNLLVDDAGEPVLVDPTFGKIQRSEKFGSLWTRCVYAGTILAQKRLQHKP